MNVTELMKLKKSLSSFHFFLSSLDVMSGYLEDVNKKEEKTVRWRKKVFLESSVLSVVCRRKEGKN